MKVRKKKIRIRRTVLFVCIFVLVCTGLWLWFHPGKDLSAGKAYLHAQESADLAAIEDKISSRKLEELRTALENADENAIFRAFDNSVIMGDSRVFGFAAYQLLPSERILADAGYTIENIPEFLDTLKTMQPETIYLSYGINDMGLQIGSDRGENGYRQVFAERIHQILDVVPDAKIVVNSILDSSTARKQDTPRWDHIEEYNAQIQAMCEEEGWIYVDNSALTKDGTADIYQEDGVHLLSWFYPIWARNMLMQSLGIQD